jgi:hypothetical protein
MVPVLQVRLIATLEILTSGVRSCTSGPIIFDVPNERKLDTATVIKPGDESQRERAACLTEGPLSSGGLQARWKIRQAWKQ